MFLRMRSQTQVLFAAENHQNCSFPQIRREESLSKNISLVFPQHKKKPSRTNMSCVMLACLGWQLLECNPAICIQGIFYSQLREPSHRACQNAWDTSWGHRTQRMMWCGSEIGATKERRAKGILLLLGRTVLLMYGAHAYVWNRKGICVFSRIYVYRALRCLFFESIEVIVFSM